jgi:hypothetical protein
VGAGNGLTSTGTSFSAGNTSITTLNVGAGTGISVGNDDISVKIASASERGGIKVSSNNSSAVIVNSESAVDGKYYPVELNKDETAIVNIPWTDVNVTNINNSTTKAYLTGTTSSTDSTGTQIFDTGIYTTNTAG